MIIDSSAILAIAFEEPEASRLTAAITRSGRRQISCLNWFEAMMVAESRSGAASADDLGVLMGSLNIGTLPFDQAHMLEAQDAWRRYGKGRHPAALNLADCCSYAASKVEARPLLFKGSDFTKTDIEAAPW